MRDRDQRALVQPICGVIYMALTLFDDFLPEDINIILKAFWFDRLAVLVKIERDLERYDWNGEYVYGVTVGSLFWWISRDSIVVDEVDLRSRGSISFEHVCFVCVYVYKGISNLFLCP